MIPVLILIAGLILWLATTYDTVGIILTIAGGVLVLVQFVVLGLAMTPVLSASREIRRELKDRR